MARIETGSELGLHERTGSWWSSLLKAGGIAALSLGLAGTSQASTSHYFYDSSGRLIGMTAEGAQQKAYRYDPSGNRTFYQLGAQTGPVNNPAVLYSGQALYQGATLNAGDGAHVISMQEDGNVVLYHGSTGLWSTGTYLSTGAVFLMQSDGNLVLLDAQANTLWASGTAGHPGAAAVLQTDGNFVIYTSNGTPIWGSNTYGQ